MAREIEVRSIVNSLYLAKSKWKFAFDIDSSARIMRQLLMRLQSQLRFIDAILAPPIKAPLFPFFEEILVRAFLDKVLHLHLLELARAKEKILRVDLIAKCFPDL